MQFDPTLAPKEEEFKVFPEGIYKFKIYKADDTVAKSSGKPKFQLTLIISNDRNEKTVVHEHLLHENLKRLRKITSAIGKEAQFDTGRIESHHLTGGEGECMLIVEPAAGPYPEKNKVLWYKAKKEESIKTDSHKFDEDLPF